MATSPRSAQLNRPATRSCVSCAITIQPGSATDCSRAARLGGVPMMVRRSAEPPVIMSLMMTRPVAMPMRTRSGVCSGLASWEMVLTMSSDARTARSGSFSVATG